MNSEPSIQIQTESPAPHPRDLFYPPHPLPDQVTPSAPVHEPIQQHEFDRLPAAGPLQETVSLIRLYFSAYQYRDRDIVEDLLAPDFSFSSPLNHRLNRESYFRDCWPLSPRFTIHIKRIFEKGNEAFVTYECERNDGTRFRNTGFFILREGTIRHIHIYCDSPDDIAPPRQPNAGLIAALLS